MSERRDGEDLPHADLEQRLTASPRVHIVNTPTDAVEKSMGIAGASIESPAVQTKVV